MSAWDGAIIDTATSHTETIGGKGAECEAQNQEFVVTFGTVALFTRPKTSATVGTCFFLERA